MAKRPKGARGSSLLRVLQREEVATPRAVIDGRSPCPGLWKTPVIRHDGALMACCADVDGEIPLGSLKQASFPELWFGETMQRYRRLHVEGRFDEMPKCWDCGGINFYKLDHDEVRAWTDEQDLPGSWDAYRRRMKI